MVNFGNDWDAVMQGEFDRPYYQELRRFLIQEYRSQTIYPGMYDIYNAMKYTPYHSVRAVILGQDPYHGPNQAHGLSFSVRKGVAPPPSLVNIFKEIRDDSGIDNLGRHGELTKWAQSGVLLLNTVLTVRAGQAGSHRGKGWEQLTDCIIEKLNQRPEPIVFLLWGANARSKQALITAPQHLVLTAAHPSPLSAYNGFFGCRHFSKTNEFLRSRGLPEIDWSIGD
ncbi:MAG: uracil-DNA glycosylase [Ruminococcus sp.]|nr:uracil-DNA glycosylase [Ruminococcus sp.]